MVILIVKGGKQARDQVQHLDPELCHHSVRGGGDLRRAFAQALEAYPQRLLKVVHDVSDVLAKDREELM